MGSLCSLYVYFLFLDRKIVLKHFWESEDLYHIWYLLSAVLLSKHCGKQLTIILFLSCQFVEKATNGTFPVFCEVDVFCLVGMTLQYLEHTWVIRMALLMCSKNLFLAFPKVITLFQENHTGICSNVVWSWVARYAEKDGQEWFSNWIVWNLSMT